ncbi:hypothetical protein D3C74_145060 [compost metagenome]
MLYHTQELANNSGDLLLAEQLGPIIQLQYKFIVIQHVYHGNIEVTHRISAEIGMHLLNGFIKTGEAQCTVLNGNAKQAANIRAALLFTQILHDFVVRITLMPQNGRLLLANTLQEGE